jgi:hypothetical protein
MNARHAYVYMSIHVKYKHMHAYMHVFMDAFICMHACIYACIHACICMYAHKNACMYVPTGYTFKKKTRGQHISLDLKKSIDNIPLQERVRSCVKYEDPIYSFSSARLEAMHFFFLWVAGKSCCGHMDKTWICT